MKIARLAALAALIVLPLASSAVAEQPSTEFRFAFKFDREAPAEATYAKLKSAAREACWTGGGFGYRDPLVSQCADQLISRTIAAIGDDRLAQLHARSVLMASAK